MADVDLSLLTAWVRAFARVIGENAQLLTDLDAAIGDADHGINMDRGMTAVLEALDSAEETAPADMAALCKQVGMTLVKSVGGASGPLYGTFFLRMAGALGAGESVDAVDFAKALRAGVEGVVQRGRAEAGDKTMFDALAPALDALDAALASGGGLAVALADASRCGRKGPRCNRIHGRQEGPRQLPRAAQRRPHGSGRHVGGDADRGGRVGLRHRRVRL